MKQRNLFSAAMALLLSTAILAGCAAAPKDAVTSEPPTSSTPAPPGSSGPSKPVEPDTPAQTGTPTPEDDTSFPAQLQLIADSVKTWAVDPDFADDRTGYAVTDLDNNGRLELIAANQGGTGQYTYAFFYEVNKTFTALDPLAYNFPEGDSQPDLMDTDPIPLFWGGTSDAFTYIFRDWGKASAADYWEALWALTLQDGVLAVEPLGTKLISYDPNGGEAALYTNAAGNPITAAEYENFAAAYPDRTQSASVIHWLIFNRGESILTLDADTLLQQLTESCRSSGVTDGLPPAA